MIRFAADEDFNNHIVRGLRRRLPEVDIVRAQDVDLCGVPDADVLAWVAETDRVLVSHDVSTMTAAAHARIACAAPLPGLIIVPQSLAIRTAIDELVIVATCSLPEDWANQVRFVPLA